MASNVHRDGAPASASSGKRSDARVAHALRVLAIAERWAALHAQCWPSTRWGEPDPGPRPSHASLSSAESAMLEEIRKGSAT